MPISVTVVVLCFFWVIPCNHQLLPLMGILDHADPLGIPEWVSPLAGLVFFIPPTRVESAGNIILRGVENASPGWYRVLKES